MYKTSSALTVPARERKRCPLIGQPAPEIILKDQYDRDCSLHATVELGRPIVLFFFPLAGSPHCTLETCSFRDALGDSAVFSELDAIVIGISQDSPETLKRFVNEHDLGYIILSDPKRKAMESFGVSKAWLGLINNRCTFVIDHDGIVRGMCEGVLDGVGHKKFAERWLVRLEHELANQGVQEHESKEDAPSSAQPPNDSREARQEPSSLRPSKDGSAATLSAPRRARKTFRRVFSTKRSTPPPLPPTYENFDEDVRMYGQVDSGSRERVTSNGSNGSHRDCERSSVHSSGSGRSAGQSSHAQSRTVSDTSSGMMRQASDQGGEAARAKQASPSRNGISTLAPKHFAPSAAPSNLRNARPQTADNGAVVDSLGMQKLSMRHTPAQEEGNTLAESPELKSAPSKSKMRSASGAHSKSSSSSTIAPLARPLPPNRTTSRGALRTSSSLSSSLSAPPVPPLPSSQSLRFSLQPLRDQNSTNGLGSSALQSSTLSRSGSSGAFARPGEGRPDSNGRVTPTALGPRPPARALSRPATPKDEVDFSGQTQPLRRASLDSINDAQIQEAKRFVIHKEPVSPRQLSRNDSISRQNVQGGIRSPTRPTAKPRQAQGGNHSRQSSRSSTAVSESLGRPSTSVTTGSQSSSSTASLRSYAPSLAASSVAQQSISDSFYGAGAGSIHESEMGGDASPTSMYAHSDATSIIARRPSDTRRPSEASSIASIESTGTFGIRS